LAAEGKCVVGQSGSVGGKLEGDALPAVVCRKWTFVDHQDHAMLAGGKVGRRWQNQFAVFSDGRCRFNGFHSELSLLASILLLTCIVADSDALLTGSMAWMVADPAELF
jgi:hypothetical protein